jgi:hypothetical protein
MKFTMGIVGSFVVIAGNITLTPANNGTYWSVPNYHTLVAYCVGPGGAGGGGAPGGNNVFYASTGSPGTAGTEFFSATPLLGYPGQGGTGAYCNYSTGDQPSDYGASGSPGAVGPASGGDTNTSGGGSAGGNGGVSGYVGGHGGAGGLAIKTWALGAVGAPVPHSSIYVQIGSGGTCGGGYAGSPGTDGFIYLAWS